MKKIAILLTLSTAALSLSACVTPGPVYGNVEEVSRRSPVTDLPYTQDDTYVPAAIEYSRGRVPEQTININQRRYNSGYGGHGHGHGYHY